MVIIFIKTCSPNVCFKNISPVHCTAFCPCGSWDGVGGLIRYVTSWVGWPAAQQATEYFSDFSISGLWIRQEQLKLYGRIQVEKRRRNVSFMFQIM